jgi:DNA helicase-2/ATP-dependent DNA helicase PcrA
VAQFFGRPVAAGEDPGEPARTPAAQQAVPTRQPQRAARPATAAAKPGVLNHGVKVKHQRYGVGKVVRREGDGEEAKVTVMFQLHGLKKMIVKYAGLQPV